MEPVLVMLLGFAAFLLVLYLAALVYQVANNLRGGSFRVHDKLRVAADEFRPLLEAPRELWIVYVLKLLESYSYFSSSIILTLFLSEDFGYDDVDAGLIYGLHGMLVSVYGIFIGFVIDNLGVRKSLLLGHVVLGAGRLALGLGRDKWVVMLSLFCILPIGLSLGIPVMMTGIRRYTTARNRTVAFGLFYQVMNVSALIAGPVVDALRESMRGQNDPQRLSAYQVVMLSGAGTTFVGLVIVVLTVREVEVDERTLPADSNNGQQPAVKEFVPKQGSPWTIAREIMRESRFWRFMLFIALLIGVKMVFRHLDGTFPKWMVRSFGEEVAFGTVYAINPFLIIVLVPFTTALTRQRDPLLTITVGAWISSVSLFVLVWQSMVAAVLFVVVLSVGEAIWSPRLYEYTTLVAPRGREGTYASLSSAPYFLAKLGVGYIGGALLADYCPAAPCYDGWKMWLIIGITTVIGPIGIVVFYSYIHGDGAGLEAADPTPRDTNHDHDPDEEQQRLLGKSN